MTSPAASGSSLPAEARPRERTPLLPLLGWAGFAILVLYTVLLGGGWIGVYSAGIRVVSLSIVSLGLATWLIVAWRRPAWRPSTAIWPAFVLPLATFGISTIASPFPRLGLDYVAWAVLLTALYLLLVRILAMPYARARIGGLMAVLAVILGGAYVPRWPACPTRHTRASAILLALVGWAGFAMLVLYTVLLGGSWIGIYWRGCAS